MPLGPLRVVCVQPAPKSRLAVTGLFAYEDQKQIKVKSRSRSKADQDQKLPGWSRSYSPSQSHRLHALLLVGPALAGKRPVWAPSILRSYAWSFPRSAW